MRERALAEIQSWEEITKSGQIPSVSSGFVKYFLTGKGSLIRKLRRENRKKTGAIENGASHRYFEKCQK